MSGRTPALSHDRRRAVSAALALAFALAPAVARAQAPQPGPPAGPPSGITRLVDEGVRCYQELDYGCAIDRLQKALVDLQTGGHLEPAAELRARLHLAFALLAAERLEDARGQLRRVLLIDPRFSLDPAIVSPRIVSTLDQVRRELLAPSMPADLDPGDPLPLPTHPEPPDSLLRPVRIARAGASLDVVEEPRYQVDLGGGAQVLTGDDAGRYQVGPGLVARFLWRVDELWAVGIGTSVFLHAVGGDLDLGQGAPNSLWVLGLQPQAGLSTSVTPWLSLEALAVLGAVVYGHDGLDGGAGIEVGVVAGARFRVSRVLSVALHATPLVAFGTANEASVSSFSVPITLEAGFAF